MIPTRGQGWPPFPRAAFLVVGAAVGYVACSSSAAVDAALSFSSSSFERRDGFLLPSQDQPEQASDSKLALVMPVAKLNPALASIAAWSMACPDDSDLPIDLVLYLDPDEALTFDLETLTTSHAVLLEMITCFHDFKVVMGDDVRIIRRYSRRSWMGARDTTGKPFTLRHRRWALVRPVGWRWRDRECSQ